MPHPVLQQFCFRLRRRRHNILQARFSILLTQWAGDRGEVGSEYRFYLYEEGEKPSSLVPDVAYCSFDADWLFKNL
ncbi:MAG: hypothetical protein JO029_07395 [Candidatus Eremiobacteraeota bacterium]|nr:hypothetical protein [Candidatus Eremiobacteraeota bacterium]